MSSVERIYEMIELPPGTRSVVLRLRALSLHPCQSLPATSAAYLRHGRCWAKELFSTTLCSAMPPIWIPYCAGSPFASRSGRCHSTSEHYQTEAYVV